MRVETPDIFDQYWWIKSLPRRRYIAKSAWILSAVDLRLWEEVWGGVQHDATQVHYLMVWVYQAVSGCVVDWRTASNDSRTTTCNVFPGPPSSSLSSLASQQWFKAFDKHILYHLSWLHLGEILRTSKGLDPSRWHIRNSWHSLRPDTLVVCTLPLSDTHTFTHKDKLSCSLSIVGLTRNFVEATIVVYTSVGHISARFNGATSIIGISVF